MHQHQSLLTSYLSRFPLNVGLGFRKADDFVAILPLAALFQQFDPFEALQDIALGGDGAGSF